jgi:hypothetical protein
MMRRSVTPLAYLSAQGEWRWWLEEWNRKQKNFKEMQIQNESSRSLREGKELIKVRVGDAKSVRTVINLVAKDITLGIKIDPCPPKGALGERGRLCIHFPIGT